LTAVLFSVLLHFLLQVRMMPRCWLVSLQEVNVGMLLLTSVLLPSLLPLPLLPVLLQVRLMPRSWLVLKQQVFSCSMLLLFLCCCLCCWWFEIRPPLWLPLLAGNLSLVGFLLAFAVLQVRVMRRCWLV
jgi:hypothetical protein